MDVVEYNFIHPDRNRIFSIVSEKMLEHRKKYDVRKIEIKYNTKFYDKMKNKTKIVHLNVKKTRQ